MFQAKIRFLGQDAITCQQIRRIPMPDSYSALFEKVSAILKSQNFVLRYIDEQEDAIMMSTQEEFEIACQIGKEAKNQLLLIDVLPKETNTLEKRADALFELPPRKGMMGRFVSSSIPDCAVFAPNTPFVQKFRFRNESNLSWPVGCKILFVGGLEADKMTEESFIIANPSTPLAPGEEIEIPLPCVSPAKPGKYIGYWRLSTPAGIKFGQRAWVQIVVSSQDGLSAIPTVASDKDVWSEKLEKLASMGYTDQQKNKRMLIRHNGDVDAVVEKLKRKEEGNSEHPLHRGFHHGLGRHFGRHHWGQPGRRFGSLDEAVVKVLEQVPEKARDLPTEAKLDFLEAHHIGVSRAQNQTVLAAHNGRLKKTVIALMTPNQ
jgi:hypothetical protein